MNVKKLFSSDPCIPEPHFKFVPTPDITAYDLAVILNACNLRGNKESLENYPHLKKFFVEVPCPTNPPKPS